MMHIHLEFSLPFSIIICPRCFMPRPALDILLGHANTQYYIININSTYKLHHEALYYYVAFYKCFTKDKCFAALTRGGHQSVLFLYESSSLQNIIQKF